MRSLCEWCLGRTSKYDTSNMTLMFSLIQGDMILATKGLKEIIHSGKDFNPVLSKRSSAIVVEALLLNSRLLRKKMLHEQALAAYIEALQYVQPSVFPKQYVAHWRCMIHLNMGVLYDRHIGNESQAQDCFQSCLRILSQNIRTCCKSAETMIQSKGYVRTNRAALIAALSGDATSQGVLGRRCSCCLVWRLEESCILHIRNPLA